MAVAGTPGRFDPASPLPADLADLAQWWPVPVTAWGAGWYVTLADASDAYWGGASWVAGRAPDVPDAAAPKPIPTATELRDWVRLTVEQLSEHDLGVIRSGEIASQRAECRIPATLVAAGLVPAPLAEALYRRVARAIAARGIPLGMRSGDGEFGPVSISSYDAEITRLEGPYRRFVTG